MASFFSMTGFKELGCSLPIDLAREARGLSEFVVVDTIKFEIRIVRGA